MGFTRQVPLCMFEACEGVYGFTLLMKMSEDALVEKRRAEACVCRYHLFR